MTIFSLRFIEYQYFWFEVLKTWWQCQNNGLSGKSTSVVIFPSNMYLRSNFPNFKNYIDTRNCLTELAIYTVPGQESCEIFQRILASDKTTKDYHLWLKNNLLTNLYNIKHVKRWTWLVYIIVHTHLIRIT